MSGSTMVEREAELSALNAAATEAAEGAGRLVLITGEAGIGKTTVWSNFVDDLPAHWTVEFVGGHHTDRSFTAPFQHLAGALPGEGEAARELAGAVADACRQRAADGPVLLVVEDLHYIDPVAVTALPHLLNSLRRAPVLVLATYRTGSHGAGTAHSGAVAELLRHARASELALRPLTEDGVRALVRLAEETPAEESPAEDPAEDPKPTSAASTVDLRAAGLFARTGGNPFFVDALLRSGNPDQAQIPWTVTEAVLSLVDSLPADARSLAELAATAARPISTRTAGALVPAWDVAARSLVAAGLAHPIANQTTDSPSGVRLRHALVAEALLAALSVSDRVSLHLRLAGAIETAHGNDLDPDDVEALAVHLSAGDAGERAAPWAARAADHLVGRGGHVRATELYELAMADVAAAAPTDRAGFFERAATAAATAGRKDLARTWGLSAVAAREAEGRSWQTFGSWVNPVLMRLLNDNNDSTERNDRSSDSDPGSTQNVNAHDVNAHDVNAHDVNAHDGPRTSDPEIEALVAEAQAAIEDGDLERGHLLAVEADERAREVGDHASRANAALVFLYAGDPDRADVTLDEVAVAAREARDWATVSVARSRSCRIPMARGYVGDAVERNAVGADAGKRAGGPEFWAHLTLGTAFIETLAGEIRTAEARCEEALQFDLPMLPEIAKASRANIALERGNLHEARTVLDSLVPIVRVLGVVYFSYPILTLQARLQLLEGDASGALDTLDELDALGASPFHEFGVDPRLTRAIAYHLLGDDHGMRAVRSGFDELTVILDGPNNLAARSFVAALSVVAANSAAAADLFERAGIDWERAPRWSLAAESYCEAALCLASTDTDRALQLVRRALVLARRAGLDRVAWRASVLESMCLTLITPSPDPPDPRANSIGANTTLDSDADFPHADAGDWVSEVLAPLTHREREITKLVAGGRTNKEIATLLFLSDKTVRNYLSSAFSKLGITRRTEVAPLLQRRPT